MNPVREVEVELDTDNYEVLRIDDECIELELHPEVVFTVYVDYVDYDYAQYDREDGVWYGTEPELEFADLDMAALMDVIE